MMNLKRVMRHLNGTVSLGLTYGEDAELGDDLVAYVDADHAGGMEKGYSTTAAVMYPAGTPVDWISKIQEVAAISKVEAEYGVLSNAFLMIVHLRHQMRTASRATNSDDSVRRQHGSCFTQRNRLNQNPRMKHVDIKFHHTWPLIKEKVVNIIHTKTDSQKADALTKRL